MKARFGRSIRDACGGMAAKARTPVLPEATPVGALSAQRRSCWLEERLGRCRPEADLQQRACERAESTRKRTLAEVVGAPEVGFGGQLGVPFPQPSFHSATARATPAPSSSWASAGSAKAPPKNYRFMCGLLGEML